MAATKVQIARSAALALFAWCGWKSAGNWPTEKLIEKFKDVPDVVPTGQTPPDEATAKALIDVTAGLESGSEFEIVDEQAAVSTPAAPAAAPAETAPAPSATESVAPSTAAPVEAAVATTAPVTATAATTAAPAASKPKKERQPRAPKAPKPEPTPSKGVRDEYGRGYYAGRVLQETGCKEVTKAMVDRVNELCGQPNDHMSHLALVWGYNNIRGYNDSANKVAMPPPTLKDMKRKKTDATPPADAPAADAPEVAATSAVPAAEAAPAEGAPAAA